MHAIVHDNLSHAWNEALQYLVARDGKAVHLAVGIRRPLDAEDQTIRETLDAFVEERRQSGKRVWPTSTVANTMFPSAFYRRDRDDARERLYALHAKAQRIQERMRDSENYFNRLVAYPTAEGETFNQLEYIVDRLVTQRKPRKRGGPLASAYEIGLTIPGGDLRVQAPGQDRKTMGFPCLSQISLTLDGDVLNLAAMYRNQYFVTRAYGNYLGLARIGDFIATEVGVELGEVMCVATHADVQFGDIGAGRVQQLARTLRGITAPTELSA